MRDRKNKKIRWILSVFSTLVFSFAAYSCGGGSQKQIGGIVGEVRFNTQACVPQQKIINIRNDDTTNPQRVMGVYFELGTNQKNNYKIDKVVVGGTEYEAAASLAQEILIPAGGIMSIYTSYKPKQVTSSGPDLTYLDMFLNGPKLGILQIKMFGESPTAAEGCKPGSGNEFKIEKMKVTIVADSLPGGKFEDEVPGTELTSNLVISGEGANSSINKDDFPNFKIDGSAFPGGKLDIELSEDVNISFDGKAVEGEGVSFKAAGAIDVTGKLSTGNSSANGSKGQISLDGSPLGDDGKMKLVFTAILNSPVLESYGFNGAVVGFEMELTKQ